MPCTFVWGNVMCFCFVLTFSASDGVDVWHLQLDKAQLDSHVNNKTKTNIMNNKTKTNIILK